MNELEKFKKSMETNSDKYEEIIKSIKSNLVFSEEMVKSIKNELDNLDDEQLNSKYNNSRVKIEESVEYIENDSDKMKKFIKSLNKKDLDNLNDERFYSKYGLSREELNKTYELGLKKIEKKQPLAKRILPYIIVIGGLPLLGLLCYALQISELVCGLIYVGIVLIVTIISIVKTLQIELKKTMDSMRWICSNCGASNVGSKCSNCDFPKSFTDSGYTKQNL